MFGVDPAAFTTYDQTRIRSGADVLGLVDEEYTTTLAATLRLQSLYESGDLAKSVRHNDVLGNDQILALNDAYPRIKDHVTWCYKDGRVKNPEFRLPQSVTAFLRYQFSERDAELARVFFDRVIRRIGVEEGSQEAILITRLSADDIPAKKHTAAGKIEIMALVIKAWNQIRSGKPPLKFLKWTNDVFPTIA